MFFPILTVCFVVSGCRWSVDERRVDTETSEYPSFKQSRQALLPAPVEQPAQQGERFPFRQLQNQEGLHITLQQLQGSRHTYRHRSPELNTIPIQQFQTEERQQIEQLQEQ